MGILGSMSIVGVEPNKKDSDRVGVKAPARLLCITEEDPVSEIHEITHTVPTLIRKLGTLRVSVELPPPFPHLGGCTP